MAEKKCMNRDQVKQFITMLTDYSKSKYNLPLDLKRLKEECQKIASYKYDDDIFGKLEDLELHELALIVDESNKMDKTKLLRHSGNGEIKQDG